MKNWAKKLFVWLVCSDFSLRSTTRLHFVQNDTTSILKMGWWQE